MLATLSPAILALFSMASQGAAQGSAVRARAPRPQSRAARGPQCLSQGRGTKEHLSSLSLSVSLAKDVPAIDVTAGTTRYGSGPPVTPASLYQIGSNTKAFTAVARDPTTRSAGTAFDRRSDREVFHAISEVRQNTLANRSKYDRRTSDLRRSRHGMRCT